jgi:hypothetical protein
MDARGIRTADEAVHFAQILGMADPLTLALAQVGQFTLAAPALMECVAAFGRVDRGRSPLRRSSHSLLFVVH